ncbi:hypothetical protein CYLTODRAFT_426299 [Cylindrobasidium torrendii FP15055 ss-10]|uniref:DUF924-domain-containing protein n=1 Tax=Cylindrobasidium torrendii FP15055 ss-10 TaxID=1314674 RepID=A0A0D7AXX6_9AGAR|nr:hypothetical protein CYLTODRAFT_426299 [Cylindrobasidium torrendii FP15055 ss-10]
MSAPSQADVSTIITPAILQTVLDIFFPWPKDVVDVKAATQHLMAPSTKHTQRVFDAVHFQVLKPLSSLRPDIPDVSVCLPRADDPVYAERVCALILLIDQVPRFLYNRGLDAGWIYLFFDQITQKLVKKLLAEERFPDSTSLWTGQGYTLQNAFFHKFLMYAPLIHSDDWEDHELVDPALIRMREEVEAFAGRIDRGRATRDADREDLYLFSKMIIAMAEAGAPPETFDGFFFWIVRLFDAHYGIVKRFGRYPYRNSANGRESTEEEVGFLVETEGFGESRMTREDVEKARENARNGTWEELSDTRPVA